MAEPSSDDISKQLQRFRDAPVAQPANPELYGIFEYLVLENTPARGPVHWFCAQAQPLITEAATFLLRLKYTKFLECCYWREHL